jgi:hypothetical protein
MAAKQRVTVSAQPTTLRPNSAQRRAAEFAAVSTKQAELKHEAAERRAKRALNGEDPSGIQAERIGNREAPQR